MTKVYFRDEVVEVPDDSFVLADIRAAFGIDDPTDGYIVYRDDLASDECVPVVTLPHEPLPRFDVEYAFVSTADPGGRGGDNVELMEELIELGRDVLLSGTTTGGGGAERPYCVFPRPLQTVLEVTTEATARGVTMPTEGDSNNSSAALVLLATLRKSDASSGGSHSNGSEGHLATADEAASLSCRNLGVYPDWAYDPSAATSVVSRAAKGAVATHRRYRPYILADTYDIQSELDTLAGAAEFPSDEPAVKVGSKRTRRDSSRERPRQGHGVEGGSLASMADFDDEMAFFNMLCDTAGSDTSDVMSELRVHGKAMKFRREIDRATVELDPSHAQPQPQTALDIKPQRRITAEVNIDDLAVVHERQQQVGD